MGSYKVPEPARRVRNGDVIRLAGRDMFAMHTPGHTLDHLCIHDPEGGFVFTGDHLLPHITPYISGLAERHQSAARLLRVARAHGRAHRRQGRRCRPTAS